VLVRNGKRRLREVAHAFVASAKRRSAAARCGGQSVANANPEPHIIADGTREATGQSSSLQPVKFADFSRCDEAGRQP